MHQATIKDDLTLEMHLTAAADAAHQALERMQPERKEFLQVLRRFELAVGAADLEVSLSASEGVREATNECFSNTI